MDIGGKTRLYGIFGYPIGHTLSPKLHNAVFRKRKIDAVYLPFEVKPDYISEAIEALKSLGIAGVNVTLPHKESAAKFADEIPSDADRAIGAVNTLVLKGGEALGYNTDGPGFLEDLKEGFGFRPKDRRVLMIGAGGAARSVAFYLLKDGCGELIVYNRTPERASGLAGYLAKFFPKGRVRSVLSIEELGNDKLDLVVNASACGMKLDDPFPVNPDVFRLTELAYDVIYSPAETKFLVEAKKRKLRCSNGLGMLVRQAAYAHCLWFPDAPKEEVVSLFREAYRS